MNRFSVLACALAFASFAHAGPREDFARYTQGLKAWTASSSRRCTRPAAGSRRIRPAPSRSPRRACSAGILEPNPQLIVADGDHVWIYDPDLEQVTVKNQGSQEAQSPLYVLIDPTELDRRYVLGDAGTHDGLKWMSLAPKQKDEDAGSRSRCLASTATTCAT